MKYQNQVTDQIVRAVFRVWQGNEDRCDEHVIALFPERPATPYEENTCQVYSYHQETLDAEYEYCISKSRLAHLEEYEELQQHLERVYQCRIVPVSKRTVAMQQRFKEELRQWQSELDHRHPSWREKRIWCSNYLPVRKQVLV